MSLQSMEMVFIKAEAETVEVKRECTQEEDPLSLGNLKFSLQIVVYSDIFYRFSFLFIANFRC